jgi:hypothetical protein
MAWDLHSYRKAIPPSPLFFLLASSLPTGKSKDSTWKTTEQIEQESVTSWTHQMKQTGNLGHLPTYILLELTQFHRSESATPPGEHDTPPALEGTTKSIAAGGQIATNGVNIHLHLVGVGQIAELPESEWQRSNTAALWWNQQHSRPPWRGEKWVIKKLNFSFPWGQKGLAIAPKPVTRGTLQRSHLYQTAHPTIESLGLNPQSQLPLSSLIGRGNIVCPTTEHTKLKKV